MGEVKIITIRSTGWKIFSLFFLLIISTFFFLTYVVPNVENYVPWMLAGAFGGLTCSALNIYFKSLGFIFAPLFSLLEGFFLGGIISIMNESVPGYPLVALAINFSIFFFLLLLESTGRLKRFSQHIPILTSITKVVGAFYIIIFSLIMAKFAGYELDVPFLQGWTMTVINVIIVFVAILNYILDFELIKDGVKQKYPAFMEWYIALAFVVTAIWVQIEVTRLPIGFGF